MVSCGIMVGKNKMPKRTKQQIKADEAKLLEKKKKALQKLNEHIDNIAALSPEDIQKVNDFIGLSS